MSGRANRRAMKSSARSAPAGSRRTPVRARTGRNIPWVPIVVVAGIAAIASVVIFLVLQANHQAGPSNEKWAAAERSIASDTTLPGQGVDLETIYKGTYGATSGNNTGQHVTHAMDYATEQGLPPAGGPHWGSSACGQDPASAPPFCGPVPWGIYRQPWPAESLGHNIEHAGVVVWYNTTNQQIIAELEADITARLKKNQLLVLVPFPDLEKETIAVTAWSRRDKFPVSEYTQARVDKFIDVFKCRFNPEKLSGSGC